MKTIFVIALLLLFSVTAKADGSTDVFTFSDPTAPLLTFNNVIYTPYPQFNEYNMYLNSGGWSILDRMDATGTLLWMECFNDCGSSTNPNLLYQAHEYFYEGQFLSPVPSGQFILGTYYDGFGGTLTISDPPVAIVGTPEPFIWLLLLMGLLMLMGYRRGGRVT